MRPSLAIALVALISACKGNQAPLLGKIADQRALVNQELALRVDGRDTDGDPVTWVVESASLGGLAGRSRFDADRKGATFVWTPLISDIGDHEVTVGLSDGEITTSRTFSVSVGVGEGSTSPVFVQPLGTGGTLDLARQACLEIPIAVTDPDTPGVTLGQGEPGIQGAELQQLSELEGTWSWCPTREQVGATDRYSLRLTADDFENPTVTKDYLVVLRGGDGSDCPGEFPTVRHSPQDWSWVSEVQVEADIDDDMGLKFEPLLYYTTSDPGPEPDVAQMIQVTMELRSGSMDDGTWVATIPNPVAGDRTGATADLWYLISAADNDDVEGLCDHTTLSPSEGAHRIEVTNTGEGGGGGEICEPCSADVQCGGADDLCVNFAGGYHCFEECTDDDDCPGDHYCSFSTFTSIDGEQGRQCLPVSLSCEGDPGGTVGGGGCDDDRYEDNDSSWDAAYLSEGTYALVSCPDAFGGDDEDWFEFDVFGDTEVEVLLDGGNASDLDLQLLDAFGGVLDRGETSSSFEAVAACVPSGTYRLRVYAYGDGEENDYDLDLDLRSGSCPGTCNDDSYENDDSMGRATYADLDAYVWRAYDRQICSDDDDWYEVYLFAGEELHATLDFFQATADQDLDLWFVGPDGTNYSDCTEADPYGCDALNGQSGNSDERMAWSINVEDYYYVVVHGWDGSENRYDICLGLAEWDCP
jgi:hypothetical protein